jgi:hypothetical protein
MRLWSPGIDSTESISPAYVAWRAGTKNRVVVQTRQAGNRFPGSLKGLQIRALSPSDWCSVFTCQAASIGQQSVPCSYYAHARPNHLPDLLYHF